MERSGPRGPFRGWRCRQCGRLAWQEGALCGRCGAADLEPREFSGRGALYSYTRVHVSSPRFREEVPYLLALVDLAEGVRVLGRLVGEAPDSAEGAHPGAGSESQLGAAVELIGVGEAGPIFRLAG
ncbi:MAG: Zn-ribbon domain-containing OB-fold protein [Nitrospinota bacterium]